MLSDYRWSEKLVEAWRKASQQEIRMAAAASAGNNGQAARARRRSAATGCGGSGGAGRAKARHKGKKSRGGCFRAKPTPNAKAIFRQRPALGAPNAHKTAALSNGSQNPAIGKKEGKGRR